MDFSEVHLPGTPVNRAVGGYFAGFDSAEPLRAEVTSRTPETRRRPSIKESSSSSRLPLPKTSSASSSSVLEPGRTTMRSKGTSALFVEGSGDYPSPFERIESLRPALHFRVPLGDSAHELEVLR
jgi:hypothetical protein